MALPHYTKGWLGLYNESAKGRLILYLVSFGKGNLASRVIEQMELFEQSLPIFEPPWAKGA